MTKRARVAVCLAAVAATVSLLLLGLGTAQGAGASTAKLKTTIHGVNFQIKSFDDLTFCMEAESGVLPGRTITLQSCGVADNQRWAFSMNARKTNLILDSQGACLDGRFHPGDEGLARPVNACAFGAEWKFVYLGSGLIEDTGNGKCLAVPGTAANAPVSLAECDVTKPTQRWLVTH